VDFCVTKDVPQDFALAKSYFDLYSDHSPVLITLKAQALNQEKQASLINRHTSWDNFRKLINDRLTLNVSFKTKDDIEVTVKFFNDTMGKLECNARTYRHSQDIRLPHIN
jgi:hypothetical protein